MTFTLKQLNMLISAKESEGLYLEFKRGAALGRDEAKKLELVKDCTGFANANGGKIIYGVAEDTVDGIAVASGFSPVLDPKIDKDWISEVLRSNSSPPLSSFEISEILFPDNAGRAIVVEVAASSTAHQNLKDYRYYQRSGAVTNPMVDFQIRDVMNRRNKPELKITLETNYVSKTPELHRYQLLVNIENIGTVTLRDWRLEIDIPADVFGDSRPGTMSSIHPGRPRMVRDPVTTTSGPVARISLSDPFWDGSSQILHPGQVLRYDPGYGQLPPFILEIDATRQDRHESKDTAIVWRMYAPDTKPIEGGMPFSEWCRF